MYKRPSIRKHPTAAQQLEAIGIEAICERLAAGESQRSIAKSLGIGESHFGEWLASDAEYAAKSREARILSARYWDEKAEEVLLRMGNSKGSIAKARELASHYRWRAKSYAPKEYGDRLDVTADIKTVHLIDLSGRAKDA